jgi:fructose-bisphosphate aldolase class II
MSGWPIGPLEWQANIHTICGDIRRTLGMPIEEVQRGICSGVRKINIDVDIRLASWARLWQAVMADTDVNSAGGMGSGRRPAAR